MNSPEDGPVGPKHVEILRYMNKIETVTSVGFSFLISFQIFMVGTVPFVVFQTVSCRILGGERSVVSIKLGLDLLILKTEAACSSESSVFT